ncbi:hypothetical protein RWE87_34540 (plasmid) [Sinorhizobium meliloti]|uniref:hypothetical protein n=1 Tax=Rhizobium meliloti TaxID=382 RepID=UPI00299D2F3E|nr:hypothetical protein [Sinorhizobium meliloti]
MTSQFYAIDPRILTPSDIKLLQSLFDEEIKARRMTYDCPEATVLAARLVPVHKRLFFGGFERLFAG